jgi:hypothetical protein
MDTGCREEDTVAERNRCGHCGGCGTCKNDRGSSCAACIKRLKLDPPESGFCGLPCSVCWGSGTVEPTSLKFQNRFVPILASVFVCLAFGAILVFGLGKNEHFGEVLAFAGTLIGSITGFYFAERGDVRRQVATEQVAEEPPAKDVPVREG